MQESKKGINIPKTLAVILSAAILVGGSLLLKPFLRQFQESQTKSEAYCEEAQVKAEKAKSLGSPNLYIDEDAGRIGSNWRYKRIWKDLLIRNNNFSDEYFEKHIRILEDYTDSPDGGPHTEVAEYFEIKYYFVVDWLSLLMKDGFVIRKQTPDRYLTEEEILKLAGDSSKPIVESPWEIAISYLRDKNGELIRDIVSCESSVKKLRETNPFLRPEMVTFRPFADGLVMYGKGKTPFKKCPRADISLTTAEVLYYFPNNPCVIE